jgi:hypothetical protein
MADRTSKPVSDIVKGDRVVCRDMSYENYQSIDHGEAVVEVAYVLVEVWGGYRDQLSDSDLMITSYHPMRDPTPGEWDRPEWIAHD